MQTCLEKKAIEKRAEELVRSDYNIHDQYGVTHKDALSTGDPQGKGTGHGGHGHSIPDCTKPSIGIDYSQFDTTAGGGQYDIEGMKSGIEGASTVGGGRDFLRNISIYNSENEYGASIIDTSANVADGQIQLLVR